ncbi:L-lysine 2,3-aminomutase [mine drainage metagenome]|uniref:L-lysine 2,3-aminomutase n=1 Tax=mine drainage metagenome TaxID=410659 RepID=T0ZUN3_9ZZZZ
MSGYAVPTYVVDLPGGGGKVPVGPTYLISQGQGRVVLRNFEGYIGTYTEPRDYTGPDMAVPPEWVRTEPGQRGVSALLAGEALAIAPQDFEDIHQRGAALHRLNQDPIKWQPRGIGD